MTIPESLKYDSDGLVPAVVQDASTRQVLMMGFMNREALEKTLESGHVTFFTRRRQKLWVKGETSGNYLLFREAFVNCENNSLLITADPIGPTCHEGYQTCYFRRISQNGEELEVVGEQVQTPEEIYGKL